MRASVFVLTLALAAAVLVVLAPEIGARPSPVCASTSGGSASCPGIVCADRDLDGRWDSGECVEVYCLHGCCGGPCPPPDWD